MADIGDTREKVVIYWEEGFEQKKD